MKTVILLSMLLGVVGCASTIVDRNFEAEEREYIKQHAEAAKDPLYAAPTADTIVAGNTDQVSVTLYKATPDKHEHLELQKWKATITNHNDYPVCVLVHWKLMDFEMISDYPDFTYVNSNSALTNYATMKQQIWNLDGTKFALPPSGYIDTMVVREPNTNTKRGLECVFEDTVHEH